MIQFRVDVALGVSWVLLSDWTISSGASCSGSRLVLVFRSAIPIDVIEAIEIQLRTRKKPSLQDLESGTSNARQMKISVQQLRLNCG